MKNRFTVLLEIFLTALILLSCEKEPLPAGIATRVHGRVFDEVNQIPISSLKIQVEEWNAIGTFPGIVDSFKGFIDSVDTDFNGDYDLTFETTGKGTWYTLSLASREDITFIRSWKKRIDTTNIGASEQVNFEVLKLYPVNLVIKTTESFQYPICISTIHEPYDIPPHPKSQLTSKRNIWLDKNEQNLIVFRIQEGSSTLKAEKFVPATNSKTIETVELALVLEDFN